jgi:hypothetical protein
MMISEGEKRWLVSITFPFESNEMTDDESIDR